ncbi:MAG: RluA family pseudouridine synthase [Burkholderiales bacterium]|nr:RluA family pseudouridine synthase [Burkholderiales bacterium]
MGGLSEGLVYMDEHLLVLDKPAGMLSVPGRGPNKQDCLSARARAMWPDALVVHRLDQATSGLFIMGRGAEAQRRLGLAFERREVGKRYVAVVAGELPPGDWQRIDLPLAVDWENRPRQVVDAEKGKPSVTRWRVMESLPHSTRVELEPLTGRSHQLRVHLQAIGHPILGDPLYAPPEVRDAAPRLLLHAAGLQLFHPMSGEAIAFESRVPF